MEIIKVKNSKIQELASLASEIWHEYWPCILSEEQIEYMVKKFQSQEALQDQILNQNYNYYFISSNNNIIGYFGIKEEKDFLFLSKLYIKKDFRHLGFGEKAFDKIKELGCKKIRLTVNKYNKNSINAYKKYGFKIIDSVVTDIGKNFVMDDFIMEYERS